MKVKLIAFLIFAALVPIMAQPSFSPSGDPRYPLGGTMGVGYALTQYSSKWKGQAGPNEYDPVHNHMKHQVVLFYERRSLKQMGSFHLDFKGDLTIGILGQTKQDYAAGAPELISDGGQNFGGNLQFRFAFPLMTSARMQFSPLIGLGTGFHMLQSNGEGLDNAYINGSYADLSYEGGWTETILQFPLSLGFHWDIETFIFSPELRWTPYGFLFSDWGPREAKPASSTNWSAIVSIGFKKDR